MSCYSEEPEFAKQRKYAIAQKTVRLLNRNNAKQRLNSTSIIITLILIGLAINLF